VLDRWEQELTGLEGGRSAAGGAWDFLLRYCRALDPDAAAAGHFLDRYQSLAEMVSRTALPADLAQADDREQARRWLDEHQALAERLREGPTFVAAFRDFQTNLRDKLLTPWDRALRTKALFLFRRRAARVALSNKERLAIHNTAITAALARLGRTLDEGREAREQRGHDFGRVRARWRAWCAGRSWLPAVGHLEDEAMRQWQEQENTASAWEEAWGCEAQRLRRFLEEIDLLLRSYDGPLAAEPAPEEVCVRLTRVRREALDLEGAAEAVAWLERHWPPPGDRGESLFALGELGLANPRP
jgi:hypothetical protein